MPKRTNEFQQIAYLVKMAMAGDAIVTESDELADRVTGQTREVDITITDQTAGHPVIVGLECRDRSRPATVEWVEQMSAKHDTLPTNLLVLVSRNGFTRRAEEKAALSGIVTLSYDDDPSDIQAKLQKELSGLWILSYSLKSEWIVVEAEDPDGELHHSTATSEAHVFLRDGVNVGTLGEVVEAYLRSPRVPDALLEAQPCPVLKNDGRISVEPKIIVDETEMPLFLRRADDVALYRMTMLHIGVSIRTAREPLDVTPARIGETDVMVGRSKVVDDSLLMVATLADDGRISYAAKSGEGMSSGFFLEGGDEQA